MTFLELCKFTHRYLGGGQDLPGTAPTTTVGQTDYLFEIVNWINDAYSNIQQESRDWNWLRARATLPVVIATNTITRTTAQVTHTDYDYLLPLVSNGAIFCLIYDPTIGVGDQTYCNFIPYEEWRGWKDRGVLPSGKPGYFTIRPDFTIELSPKPDKNYTLIADYRKTLDVLSGDSDTPLMPSQYHESIAWQACLLWAAQRESPNKYEIFKKQYDDMLRRMKNEQIPDIRLDESMFDGGY